MLSIFVIYGDLAIIYGRITFYVVIYGKTLALNYRCVIYGAVTAME